MTLIWQEVCKKSLPSKPTPHTLKLRIEREDGDSHIALKHPCSKFEFFGRGREKWK